MEPESTIQDIIKSVQRFRILCVGRSGVGKSSLINCVFGVTDAQVSDSKPGESEIQQEITSQENPFFVLHDSKGFEPGDIENFEIASQFIEQRCNENLPLKDRLHALWLCTETPTAGGRVFEAGDEKLLKLAHEKQIPVVVVFTKYDRLVRTKKMELEEDDENMDQSTLDRQSIKQAQEALKKCLDSLQRAMNRLETEMPLYVNVSVQQNYRDNIPSLVEVTRTIVRDRLEGDAWIMWAIAQRASLPVKIETCVDKGLSYFTRSLTGSTPTIGKMLLRDCLHHVQLDIVACWNFKDEKKVLESAEFQQLMLHLVQDVHGETPTSTLPNVTILSEFVNLVTAASAPIAPPVAILGLAYIFVKWLSEAFLENIPDVQSLLIAYTVDLIRVLIELFYLTLQPKLALTTSWKELQEAFETYEQSLSRPIIHGGIRSAFKQGKYILSPVEIRDKTRLLLDEYLRRRGDAS